MLKGKSQILMIHFLFPALVFSGCVSSVRGGNEPDWVRDPYAKYPSQANVAALGMGSSREIAEKDALGKLVAIFGQSIQVDEKASISYNEAIKSGVTAGWTEITSVNANIATTAGMETLVGAEIGETWDDGKGSVFAVAVLNKAKAYQLYTEMIQSNLAMIDNLLNMTASEKNSLEGYARYQFAATIAGVNASYGNLLSVIGRPVQGLKRAEEYRLEAQNVAKSIPVGLKVQNDKAGRIEGAFAKVLSDFGFRSAQGNSRYVLDVNVSTSPVVLLADQNKFTRIEMKADLIDTSFGTVLVPFGFNSREGHLTQVEADNRAYLAAERKISQDYAGVLDDYLSRLLPKK